MTSDSKAPLQDPILVLSHRRSGRNELLDPASKSDLGSVEIALRVDPDVVHPFELAELAAAPAPLREHLAVLVRQHADLSVRAIGYENVPLLRIARQHQIPHRAVCQRLWIDLELLHEAAVLAENLDAIIGTVADIDESV